MFGLKIFVRVQTFRRVPPVLPRNFCHPADAYVGAADDDDGGVEADGKGHCCTAGGGRRDRCSWDPGVTAGGDNACHGEEDEDKVELKYVDVLIIFSMHPVL